MADRAPVEKIPLAIRKNVRDNYESKKPEHEKKIANLIGSDSFTLDINPNLVLAYAAENTYPYNSLGGCINTYVEKFISSLETYTKSGKDEEGKEAFRKVASKLTLTLVPTDDAGTSYCGVQITDGTVQLLFNVKNLGTNISDIGKNLPAEVDKALDALGGNDLPVVARRAAAQHLAPLIPKLQAKMKAMFGKDYTFAYDIGAALAALRADETANKNYGPRLNTIVPEWMSTYFRVTVETLENKKFGKDDMLQEAFVDATDKLVVRFQVVDSLKNKKTYNDARFENGELLIETVPMYFGTNISDCAKDIIDRL